MYMSVHAIECMWKSEDNHEVISLCPIFTWVPGIEVRLQGLHNQGLF